MSSQRRDVAVDNDILIKCSCYDLLRFLAEDLADGGAVGVLGAARFVVRRHLQRRSTIQNRGAALAAFDSFIDQVSQLEPTAEEIALATAMEEASAVSGAGLDAGESQLAAIVLLRAWPMLLTGDKRAIAGLERVAVVVSDVAGLAGRVASLEQLVLAAIQMFGVDEVAARLCAEPSADRAMTICFQCSRIEGTRADPGEGLRSYLSHLRHDAPTMLHAGDRLLPL